MNSQRLLRPVACQCLVLLWLARYGGVQPEYTIAPAPSPLPPTPATRLDGQQALFMVYDRFAEMELDIPRAILEDLGVVVSLASSSSDLLLGSGGDKVQADLLLGDVHGGDYDAIVFVGGQGVESGSPDAHRIAREAVDEGKVVAAICAAQSTLARAGLADDKWVPDGTVERNDLVIRADGPAEAQEFGNIIAAAMGE